MRVYMNTITVLSILAEGLRRLTASWRSCTPQAKLAMMERKLNELLEKEEEAEPDDIEKLML